MDPVEGVGDHELRPQETDAVDVHRRHLLGVLGDSEIHVQPGGVGPGRSDGRRSE